MASADNDNMPSGADQTGGKCPICGKPTVKPCVRSARRECADVDLGRWMSGSNLISWGLSDADEDGEDTAAIEAGRRAESAQDPDV